MSETNGVEQVEYLLEINRVDQAKKKLQDFLQSDPENLELEILSARIQMAEEQYSQALKTVNECFARNPDHIGILAFRVDIYKNLKMFAEAEADLIALIKYCPDLGEFYAHYSLLMLETGFTDKSLKLAYEAIRLDPDSEICRLVNCLAHIILGRHGEVEKQLEELIRENPDYLGTLTLLAQKLVAEYKLKEAKGIAQQLVRLKPDDQDYIDLAIDLTAASHWTMKPFKIFTKYGWLGSFGLWFLFISFVFLSGHLSEPYRIIVAPLVMLYIAYCLASWVWPSVLKKFIISRGV